MVTTGLQNSNTNTGRFNLVLCEILNKNLHGNDANIDGHYLIINKFDASTGSAIYSDSGSDLEEDDYESDDDSIESGDSSSSLSLFTNDYNDYYHQVPSNVKHNIIRNYRNIIARPDYIRPEIAECIVLPSQHTVAIIKTMWIKIIQRKWKKVYAERKRIINTRMLYSSLKRRELTGKWPTSCNYLPTLYRMLSDIKN